MDDRIAASERISRLAYGLLRQERRAALFPPDPRGRELLASARRIVLEDVESELHAIDDPALTTRCATLLGLYDAIFDGDERALADAFEVLADLAEPPPRNVLGRLRRAS